MRHLAGDSAESYAVGVLDGTASPPDGPTQTLPSALAPAEIERAERALHLTGFDAAPAVRGPLAALSTGTGTDSMALAALTGRGPWPPVESR